MEIEQANKKAARQNLALIALGHLEWVELTFQFTPDCPEEIKQVFLRGDLMDDALSEVDLDFSDALETYMKSMYFGVQQDEEYWGHWNGEEPEVKGKVK